MRRGVIIILLGLLLGTVTFLTALPASSFEISLKTGDLYTSKQAESVFGSRENALIGLFPEDSEGAYSGPAVESPSYDLNPGTYVFSISGEFHCSAALEIYSPLYAGSDNTPGRVFARTDVSPSSVTYLVFDNDEVVRGARIRVVRSGEGAISINKIEGEGRVYSDALVLSALVFLAALFVMLMLSRRKDELERREYGFVAAFFCCALAALISTAPLARQTLTWAHDVSFHLTRIDGIADGLRSGQFPVRMNPTFLGGYGYADPTMYPSLFLYFPAALRLLGVSTIVAYQIFMLAINGLTVALSYFCFKRLFHRRDTAVFASFAYTLCLYRLICVFTRAAIGELIAMAFLPAVLLGMYELFFGEIKPGARWLSVGFLGLINCHVLSFEMTALFCLVFFLINIRRMSEKGRLRALIGSAAVVTVLSLWIILPMLDLMRTEMHATSYGRDLANDAVYPFELFATFVSSNGLSSDRGDPFTGMPLTVGGILAAGALLFLFMRFFMRSGDAEDLRLEGLGRVSLKIAAAALFLASTLFPWDAVSKIPYLGSFLSFVQFPWRYLGIASVMLVVVLSAAVSRLGDISSRRSLTLFLCAAVVALSCSPYLDGYMQNEAQGVILSKKHTPLSSFYIGGQEYMRVGTSKTLIEERDPVVTSEGAVINGMEKRYLTVTFTYSDAKAGAYAEVPLYHYNGYIAHDDLGNKLTVIPGVNGLVRVLLDDSYGAVTVRYSPPVSYRIAEAVSLLAAVLVIIILIRSGRGKTDDRQIQPAEG